MYYICVHLLCDLDLLNGTIICSNFVIVLSLDNHLLCLINRNRQEEFEDTNGEIRSRKSEVVNRRKDTTMTKRKRTNNDLQNTTQETKDRATPLRSECELMCSERVNSSWSTSDTRRVTLVTNPVISDE